MAFNTQLLAQLACPVSHAALEYDADNQRLTCAESGLAYPIRDGLPILLPNEAQPLDAE